jgi:NADPH:quinone reductase-like Zn-dependent oxidoreductase
MRAAIVTDLGQPPCYSTFEEPIAQEDEVLVRPSHAAISNLAKIRASAKRSSDDGGTPFVAGIDGVGLLEDGTRVYFAFPRAPFGAMAEIAPVRRDYIVPLPADLDSAVAAAAANAGLSCWPALIERAELKKGESVLINGATGFSGKIAIQVAKYLAADSVVAVGLGAEVLGRLASLGADSVIALDEPANEVAAAIFREIQERRVGVVLDYLAGKPAADVIEAISQTGSPNGGPRIRFVQIGSSAGASIEIPAQAIRSANIEIVGSGLGSMAYNKLVSAVGDFLHAIVPGRFEMSIVVSPLSDVEHLWNGAAEPRRVFTL